MLTFAVPKGRILEPLAKLLEKAGASGNVLLSPDRTLVRTAGDIRYLLLKADDVLTYVEYGAADVGVCGRDVVTERDSDVLVPLDLGIGVCKMMVAAPTDLVIPQVPRVATKYPRTAAAHFAKQGIQADVIQLHGSVELAPLTGLADLIVDLVETGETLTKNGLRAIETVAEISSVVAFNRAAYKLKRDECAGLIARLRKTCLSEPRRGE